MLKALKEKAKNKWEVAVCCFVGYIALVLILVISLLTLLTQSIYPAETACVFTTTAARNELCSENKGPIFMICWWGPGHGGLAYI